MEHHNIDIWPIPEDKKPCYINEPWLIDGSLLDYYAESTTWIPANPHYPNTYKLGSNY